MATLKHISFFKAFLPFVLLILAALVAPSLAHGLNSQFCDHVAPGLDQEECNVMVSNATTWDEAMRNVINAALKAAEPIKPLIKNIKGTLPQSLRPVSKDSIEQTCQEALESLLDGFNQSLGEIAINDPYTLSDDLAAAASSLSDCTDGLHQFGASSLELHMGEVEMLKYASVALSVVKHKH